MVLENSPDQTTSPDRTNQLASPVMLEQNDFDNPVTSPSLDQLLPTPSACELDDSINPTTSSTPSEPEETDYSSDEFSGSDLDDTTDTYNFSTFDQDDLASSSDSFQ